MDGKTVEQIRLALLGRKQKIDQDAAVANLNLTQQEVTSQAEIIDMAQSLEQIGREMSLAEQERKELVAIEKALAKMSTGSFGLCEECNEEIPPKRLIVLPEARLCATCQAFEERQGQRIRGPMAGMR